MKGARNEEMDESLITVLSAVPDPRSAHGRRHPLGAVLPLVVCAMLCGARSLYAISQWGRDQGGDTALASGFTRERTPAVSTLHRIFSRLDRESFERALGGWLQGRGLRQTEAVAVDGKALRGIHGEELPGLLAQLDLKGRVLTGDAQFTQRRECRQIVARGGTTSSR